MSMFDPQALDAQCIALAGLFQSLEQVQHCARSGAPANPEAVRTVLESVLRIDAPDAQSIYGNVSNLQPGLNLLAQHLARRMDTARLEQMRYAASLMGLERRLVKAPALAARLTDALRDIDRARDEHAIDDPWIVQQMATAYSNHISTMTPRVMISGEPVYLQTTENADRIRALLLAGLRAAVLWRQCGGNQLKLLMFRTTMQRAVVRLLDAPA